MQLDLAAVEVGDAPELYPIHADPQTWEHAPAGRHTSLAQTETMVEQSVHGWRAVGLDYWTARDRHSGIVVGIGGVRLRADGSWNLYYRFAASVWGRGLATELADAALLAAAQVAPARPVIAWVLDWHTASQRVARQAGLVDQGLRRDPQDGVQRRAFADRDLPPEPQSAPDTR